MIPKTSRQATCLTAALLIVCLSLGLAEGQPSTEENLSSLATRPFAEFVEASYAMLARRDPDSLWDATGTLAAAYGVTSYAELTDLSPDARAETRRLEAETLGLLRAVDRASLSADEQVTYDAYTELLEDRLALSSFPLWSVCVGPSTFGLPLRQLELLNVLPVRNLTDAESYVARLYGTARWMEQLIGVLREREAADALPTLAVLQAAAEDLTSNVLQDTATPDPLRAGSYVTFADRLSRVGSLSAADRERLQAEAATALREAIFPAYRALCDVLIELQRVASSDVGVAHYAAGRSYYAVLLRHYAGAGQTPESLHARARREVERIQGELRDVAWAAFGWPRDLPMSELTARIDAAKSTRLEGAALRAEYARLLARVEAQLPQAFGRLPTVDLGWLVDPLGPPACYQAAPLDGSAPAYFVVSLANPSSGTAYDEAVLVHHETYPGHHLQFGVAASLDVPSFQKLPLTPVGIAHPYFQAFTEGWALYAQGLAADMGLYAEDPLARLWQLRLQLTQISRAVADTGMNALGWTWPDAAAYLEAVLGVRPRQSALWRFESAPGQACGYAAGYFLLLDLRDRAQAQLGERYSLRAFHDVVLGHGALPVTVLERVVDAWIADSSSGE